MPTRTNNKPRMDMVGVYREAQNIRKGEIGIFCYF